MSNATALMNQTRQGPAAAKVVRARLVDVENERKVERGTCNDVYAARPTEMRQLALRAIWHLKMHRHSRPRPGTLPDGAMVRVEARLKVMAPLSVASQSEGRDGFSAAERLVTQHRGCEGAVTGAYV